MQTAASLPTTIPNTIQVNSKISNQVSFQARPVVSIGAGTPPVPPCRRVSKSPRHSENYMTPLLVTHEGVTTANRSITFTASTSPPTTSPLTTSPSTTSPSTTSPPTTFATTTPFTTCALVPVEELPNLPFNDLEWAMVEEIPLSFDRFYNPKGPLVSREEMAAIAAKNLTEEVLDNLPFDL